MWKYASLSDFYCSRMVAACDTMPRQWVTSPCILENTRYFRNVGNKLPIDASTCPRRTDKQTYVTECQQYTNVEAWLLSLQEHKNMAKCCASCLLNLVYGSGKFGKIWNACGQNVTQYEKWRILIIPKTINFIILNVYFSINYVQ
jgi:hypothetical protein